MVDVSDTEKQPDGWLAIDEKTATQEHVTELVTRIDKFCAERRWTEGYFSKQAAGDVGVVHRLRKNGRVTATIMTRIERFLDRASNSSRK